MTPIRKTIAVLPGDGIGPEVTRAAIQILKDCASAFGHQFDFREFPFGGNAIDSCDAPLPPETLAGCRASDAVLLGAIGGPQPACLESARNSASTSICGPFACARRCAGFRLFVRSGSATATLKSCASWPETSTSVNTKSP